MPRNGTPSVCTRDAERVDEVLLRERVDGGARGADAREHDALRGRDLLGRARRDDTRARDARGHTPRSARCRRGSR